MSFRNSLQLFAAAILLASLIQCAGLKSGRTASTPEERMNMSLSVLADDMMEGRAVGTAGEWKAATYIAGKFMTLGLTAKGDSSWFQNFSFIPHAPAQIHHTGDSAALGMALVKEIRGRNVIAFLDNQAANTVVIGAHYDHLGMGDENSLWTGPKAIHNGADDNGSGVAMLIELASWLSEKPVGTTKSNYLFIAFSGEEKGLWGSNYFTKNPTIDLKNVSYMLNMDMVGRLNAEKSLAINGTGTCPDWNQILPQILVDDIKILPSESGVGPSDHTSFYLVDIPCLHFFTGQHEDYHKPTDDAEKVNYKGMVSVLKYIQAVVTTMDSRTKPQFTKTVDKTPSTSNFKVTLGIMPDYMYSGPGLRVDGVKDGRPAAKAGIIRGDVIIKLGEKEIVGMEEYMEALGMFEMGQTVDCVVQREGKETPLKVTFE